MKYTTELHLDDGRVVSRAELAQALVAAAAAATPPLPGVKPEADASYDALAQVLALARRSGMVAIRIEGTPAN